MAQSEYHIINELARRLSTLEHKHSIMADDNSGSAVVAKQAVALMEILVRQNSKIEERLTSLEKARRND